MSATPYAIEMQNVSFSYENAPQSIHEIDLQVEQGSCHVLMGASGSGKTTIVRLINGLAGGYYPGNVSGEISIMGTNAKHLEAWQRATLVGSVFQDPATQFFSAQLAGEAAFGCENLGKSTTEIQHATDDAITLMNLNHLREQDIDTFSSGEKQRVAIAGALAPSPQILVMDEPSANLDELAAHEFGNVLKDLKARGYTLLIAEHRIAYLLDVADVFHYVQSGRITTSMYANELKRLSADKRLDMGIRGLRFIERKALPSQSKKDAAHIEGLHAQDVSITLQKHNIVADANLVLQPGTITAVTGKNGAGKTTFMRTLAGFIKPVSGTIYFNEKPLRPKALRSLVWYSPNDVSASFFTASVAEEVMLQVDPTEQNIEKARTLLKDLDLYEHKQSHPYALSGGQKQRLAVAVALMQNREVLIFDEPTSGLDAINMQRLAHALQRAAREGCAVAVVTHDSEFIEACATHGFEMT